MRYFIMYIEYTGLITSLNGSVVLIGNTNSLSKVDSGLTNGTYFYVVTAVNATGESFISNCESVRVAIPSSDTPSPFKSTSSTTTPKTSTQNPFIDGASVVLIMVGMGVGVIILGIPLFRINQNAIRKVIRK